MPSRAATAVRLGAGLAGPASFIAAWVVLGERAHGYSPVEDPISRLAAAGAPTRAAMSAGFGAFGVGVSLFAWEYRRQVPGPAWAALGATAAATFGVAAFPLDSHDTMHAVMVAPAYATLATAPLLAARRGWWPAYSVASGLVTAAALTWSVVGSPTGLFQRIGLTTGDVWIMASAVRLLRSRRSMRSGR